MGNRFALLNTKLDFVFELPSELVAVIFSFLRIEDVLKCLQVCKTWRSSILGLEPYWENLLQELGLSHRYISIGMKCFPGYNHKDFYLAARRNLSKAKTVEFASCIATCYPQYSTADCVMMGRLNLMLRKERVEGDSYVKVEEVICGGCSVVISRSLCAVPVSDDFPLVWMHYSRNGCLYWIDSTGKCRGYHTVENRSLCGEIDSLLAVTHEKKPFSQRTMQECKLGGVKEKVKTEELHVHEVEPGTARGEMVRTGLLGSTEGCFDGETVLAGCEACLMFLCCRFEYKGEPSRSSFKLLVARLGDRQVDPIEMATSYHILKHDSTHKELGYGNRSLSLIGVSGPEHNSGVCLFHYALLQDGQFDLILSIKPEMSLESSMTVPPRIAVECTCLTCCYLLSDPNLGKSGKMRTSLDGYLFGKMCGRRLYVWEAGHHTGIKLVSKAEIIVEQTKGDLLELIALGSCLSVVRHEAEKLCVSDDRVQRSRLHVIYTETGRVLNSVGDWDHKNGHSGSPRHYLLSLEAQRWLNNITSPPPRTLLIEAHSTVNGRLVFFLVQQSRKRQRKEKSHWVQAVNHSFHE